MDLFVWDQRYQTGESMVDREHRGLFELINRLADLHESKASAETLRAIVDELMRYAQVHFCHEEALMLDVGCDRRFVEAHVAAHRSFAQQLVALPANESAAIDAEYLLRFLSSWLAYHILGIDQSMARQIRKIRTGVGAFRAYEDERDAQTDPATASLLAAMKILYGVVVQRNEALQGFNEKLEEQVKARTRELAAANNMLEADIRQRELAERELQDRNSKLEVLNARFAEMGSQLLQAEKLASVGQLAAGVAHEINNPISFVLSNLSAVDGYLKSVLRALDAWEQSGAEQPPGIEGLYRQLDLDYIRQDAPALILESRQGLARVQKIVQDLRDFSQVDSAQAWLWSDLNQCMERSLALLGAVPGKLEIKKAYADLPKVLCQPAQISQVLYSLLTNAIEAMPSGGVLTLRSAVEAEQVWLEVADSGCGIAAEILPRIFEPFFTTKPLGTGNGMGLALAYGIARQHLGEISVRSEVGRGSVFRLVLPVQACDAG